MASRTLRLLSTAGISLSLGVASLLGATVAAAALQSGIVPPNNPPKSLPPMPNFFQSQKCDRRPDASVGCDSLVLKAIDNARSKEHVGPMRFNLAAFRSLTPPEQLFVTVDLERTNRGLPPVEGLTSQLNTIAWKAARAGVDPLLPSLPYPLSGGGTAAGFGGNWAGGNVNVLGSDYGWMYDDGPHSPNLDCPKAGDPGCWGHRDNILSDKRTQNWGNPAYCGGAYHFVMGAGSTKSVAGWNPSQTELLVLDCGKAPTEYFTWAQAKKLLGI